MLREGGAKRLLWHPDESVRVRCQLRRLRMRLVAIEHFGDCLAFVRRQGRYEDQRLHSLVGARRYHRAGISVRCQDHGPIGAFQDAVERGSVIQQGGEWYWSCQDIQSFGLQWPDNIVPARPVSPCTVNQHGTGSSLRFAHVPSLSRRSKLTGTRSLFCSCMPELTGLRAPYSTQRALASCSHTRNRRTALTYS